MLETHNVMSSLIFRLVLILMLRHTHLLILCLINLAIAHMVLVHVRTALCIYALVMAHVLIMVTISRVGMIFLLKDLTPILS
jgi:hypothetical protein